MHYDYFNLKMRYSNASIFPKSSVILIKNYFVIQKQNNYVTVFSTFKIRSIINETKHNRQQKICRLQKEEKRWTARLNLSKSRWQIC